MRRPGMQRQRRLSWSARLGDMECNPLGLPKMINRRGKYEYKMKDLYYHVHVANLVHVCQSRNQFAGLFRRCRESAGVQLREKLTELDLATTAAVVKGVTDIIKEQKKQYIAEVVAARGLTDQEAAAMDNDETLSAEDKKALAAYKLADFYHVQPETMTAEFVEKFDDKKVKATFSNHRQMARPEVSIEDALNKRRELKQRKTTSMDDLAVSDSTLKCMFAVDVLNMIMSDDGKYCSGIREFGELYVARDVLEPRLDQAITFLRQYTDVISMMFGVRRQRLLQPRKLLKTKLELVNSVLSATYGAKIAGADARGAEQTLYKLKPSNLFEWSADVGNYVVAVRFVHPMKWWQSLMKLPPKSTIMSTMK
eukprot:TRINITY_DN4009_c0_g2_i2.p1 TRINITY_DN4009_c0_g2~~TRINITY_DN4009_c0_g2_i2.p1  ORF type:complete len:367 (+),score=-0.22 TRINITY_DN4009_c0_g2_i2:994-2094(+)